MEASCHVCFDFVFHIKILRFKQDFRTISMLLTEKSSNGLSFRQALCREIRHPPDFHLALLLHKANCTCLEAGQVCIKICNMVLKRHWTKNSMRFRTLYMLWSGVEEQVVGDLHEFDPTKLLWSALDREVVKGNPPGRRLAAGVTAVDGSIFVFGGINEMGGWSI
jgi:hypothetical protein